MSRKLDALRALANQTDSPLEAAIAREKLLLLESREDPDYDYRQWQVRQEIEAERQRLADEAVIADLVKRWEQGSFTGVSVTAGANNSVRYKGKRS